MLHCRYALLLNHSLSNKIVDINKSKSRADQHLQTAEAPVRTKLVVVLLENR